MVSIAEIGSVVREEEHVVPTIELSAQPLEAVPQGSLEEVPTGETPTEMAPEMSIEECFEKDLIEEVQIEEAVDIP